VAMAAATWNGPNILTTSSKLGLRTEASTRFEKQLHPELALRSQRLAARLMVELCGALLAPGTVDVASDVPAARRVLLRSQRLTGLLGEPIGVDESSAILTRLGFGAEHRNGDLDVEVPYFRHYDVAREADLIEEVVRIHGLEKLPATLPARRKAVGRLTRSQKLRRLAEDFLRGRGLNEVVTYSFIPPDAVQRLGPPEADARRRVLRLANPLSEDQSAMRTTLLPGLLAAARRNFAHDIEGVRLFETGRVFFSNGQDRLPDESLHLGAVVGGVYRSRTWRSPERQADFYVAKALLVALLETLRIDWRLVDGGPSFLHPGRAAQVFAGSYEAGWLGELSPVVARSFGLGELERPPVGFELDLDMLLAITRRVPTYEDVVSYPAVWQDIAVIVDEAVEAQTVVDIVRAAAGPNLKSVRVFDLYRGDPISEDQKSLALRLEFRAPDRTLTEDEVSAQREHIRAALERHIGGTLRE